jgi:hypothetical protein
MNIEEFFDREVASAREEILRREQEEKARSGPVNKPHSSFRPFLQAVRRIGSKFEGSTEVDFQFDDHFLRIVLGDDRILEAFPQKKKCIDVVTHFLGYKVSFATQPIRFIKQFITECYLRLRIGHFLRYLFSTYEYPPWDVIERRKSFPEAAEAVEYVIRALAEYAAKIQITDELRREASED